MSWTTTLSVEEHLSVIEETVKHVNKRVPVIAGTGANNTVEAIALSKAAEQAGADYTLSVVPYYNKPSQEGIYQHFKTIAESTSIPMIIYNVPGRTVVSMTNDTILRLAKIPNIVGVKEASGNIGSNLELIKHAPEGFTVPIREVRLSAGAGFVVLISGSIMTMPGLPKRPSACDIEVVDGTIRGMH